MSKRILATQTCIVGDADTYHDYRDYIFSLLSSEFLKDEVVRINIERGQEYAKEWQTAIRDVGFTNADITVYQPESWAKYIQSQINEFKTPWTMLFPGDHIYTHPGCGYIHHMLDVADRIGVDAVSYGHIQDWDYLLDWGRIKVIEDTKEYVVIEWGWKWKNCRNKKLITDALQKIGTQIVINPVPGYMFFRSDFLNHILSAIPNSIKWHDIEHINHPLTQSFKILIPKQYIYRHVHGYWLEHYFEVLLGKRERRENIKETLEDMYMAPRYKWETNAPSRTEYFEHCLSRHSYISRYVSRGEYDPLLKYSSPFSKCYMYKKTNFAVRVQNYTLLFIDVIKLYVLRFRNLWR